MIISRFRPMRGDVGSATCVLGVTVLTLLLSRAIGAPVDGPAEYQRVPMTSDEESYLHLLMYYGLAPCLLSTLATTYPSGPPSDYDRNLQARSPQAVDKNRRGRGKPYGQRQNRSQRNTSELELTPQDVNRPVVFVPQGPSQAAFFGSLEGTREQSSISQPRTGPGGRQSGGNGRSSYAFASGQSTNADFRPLANTTSNGNSFAFRGSGNGSPPDTPFMVGAGDWSTSQGPPALPYIPNSPLLQQVRGDGIVYENLAQASGDGDSDSQSGASIADTEDFDNDAKKQREGSMVDLEAAPQLAAGSGPQIGQSQSASGGLQIARYRRGKSPYGIRELAQSAANTGVKFVESSSNLLVRPVPNGSVLTDKFYGPAPKNWFYRAIWNWDRKVNRAPEEHQMTLGMNMAIASEAQLATQARAMIHQRQALRWQKINLIATGALISGSSLTLVLLVKQLQNSGIGIGNHLQANPQSSSSGASTAGGGLSLNPGQPLPSNLIANLGSLANSVDALRASLIQSSDPMSGIPAPSRKERAGAPDSQGSAKERRAAPNSQASAQKRGEDNPNGVSPETLIKEHVAIELMADNLAMGLATFLPRFLRSKDTNMAFDWAMSSKPQPPDASSLSITVIKVPGNISEIPMERYVPEPWMDALKESVPLLEADGSLNGIKGVNQSAG